MNLTVWLVKPHYGAEFGPDFSFWELLFIYNGALFSMAIPYYGCFRLLLILSWVMVPTFIDGKVNNKTLDLKQKHKEHLNKAHILFNKLDFVQNLLLKLTKNKCLKGC